MAAELIKKVLADEGLTTSARDVFIAEYRSKLILLFRTVGRSRLWVFSTNLSRSRLLGDKKMGSFGEKILETIRKNFNQLRDLKVPYRHKATEENLGGPCFTLVWHWGSGGNGPVEETQDWDRLLAFLRRCISVRNN